MSETTNIPTRYALIMRARKIVEEVDDYFQSADDFGLSLDEADPKGELRAVRNGLLSMLAREGRLRGES